MKKRYIVILLIVLLLSFLLFLFLKNSHKKEMMECSASMTMVGSDADLKYTFEGSNGVAKEQNLYVKLYMTDENLINEYQNIMKDNLECGGIDIFDGYISYSCYYDLINTHYYQDLEDEDGQLSFERLKKDFENDNFVCIYN